MYLHEDKSLFKDVIIATAEYLSLPIAIVEKDYYVTMILKLFSERTINCVFKGGTSLSKCHHVIDRFSEDIDIAFSKNLTQGERKKLKNITIASISNELNLDILDWDKTRSKNNYNCYTFGYDPIDGFVSESLVNGVKLEVSLGTIAFPTLRLPVDSYVCQFLKIDNQDIINDFHLEPFAMSIQSIERTFIDKVYAICDYYMQRKIERHSRHIYDLYKLFPKIDFSNNLKNLINEVKIERKKLPNCPSAQDNINLAVVLNEIITTNIYKSDYETITSYFQRMPVEYSDAISVLKDIIDTEMF